MQQGVHRLKYLSMSEVPADDAVRGTDYPVTSEVTSTTVPSDLQILYDDCSRVLVPS